MPECAVVTVAKLRCLLAALLCLVPALAWAQPGPSPGNITTPLATDYIPLYGRGTSGPLFGQLGQSPSAGGPAGGDLTGTYPNPTVRAVNGVSVTGTPSVGYVPVATGGAAASWNNKIVSPLVIPSADGANFLFQNGSKTAFSIYGPPSAPAGLFDYANVRSVIDVEPTQGVQNYNAYDAWIWNNVAPTTGCGLGVGGCGHAVGLEVYCANIVASASCFGLNPAFTDSYDGTLGHSVASTMTGMEIDFSPFNAGSHIGGISIVLNNSVSWTTGGATGIQLLTTGTTQWSNGFTIGDGALVNGGAGILLGTQGMASGTSISSGSSVFSILDSAGSERHVFLQAQPNGSGNSQFAIYDGAIASVGVAFVLGPTTSSPQIVMGGTSTNSGSVVGSNAAGGGLNLVSTNNGSPSADYVKLTVGGTTIFDCGLTAANFCTLSASNGFNANSKNILNIAGVFSVNANGYELVTGAASSTAPTLVPNKADTKAGIGADTPGDVSIIVDNAGTATEVLRAIGTSALVRLPVVATGTPAASLCLDASNNIIKKTTAGSCI